MAQLQIKGTTVRDAIEGIRGRLGQERFDRLMSLLDEPSREMYRERIIATQWYPLDAFTNLLETDVREHDGGDPSKLVKRSEIVFEKQLTGIYRMFIRLGSPESLVKRIAAAHETYFRGSHVDVVACERGAALIRYRGFEARHWILDYPIVGFYRKGLQLSGAKDPEVTMAVPLKLGKGYSALTLRWR
jgi:hypothetical protein